jgi:hypothetical protein
LSMFHLRLMQACSQNITPLETFRSEDPTAGPLSGGRRKKALFQTGLFYFCGQSPQ